MERPDIRLTTVPTPRPIPQPHQAPTSQHLELVAGLLAERPHVAPKYLYDEMGSRLFDAITLLPEYYPTRTEATILAACSPELAARIGAGCTLIDLGAGDCAKAGGLLPVLAPSRYLAIDIAGDYLRAAVQKLARRFPGIPMQALAQDFSAGLRLPADLPGSHRLFFYPGSSLGNFDAPAAARLLADIRRHCMAGGALLIGVDLLKDPVLLQRAYADALGLTACFNLNLLRHVNRLLDSDFELREWAHRVRFDTRHSRIEMHLEARHALQVSWPGGGRHFRAGETIHTESSHKYTPAGIETLLHGAGFARVQTWLDPRQWFAVCLASVPDTAHGAGQ